MSIRDRYRSALGIEAGSQRIQDMIIKELDINIYFLHHILPKKEFRRAFCDSGHKIDKLSSDPELYADIINYDNDNNIILL